MRVADQLAPKTKEVRLGKKKQEFKAWKKRQKTADGLETELQIPIEGFYNFYAVPWDADKYVKFPCTHLWIGPDPKASPQFAASQFCVTAGQQESYDGFMSGYLGTARLTDEFRLRKITEYRTELELP